MYLIYTIELMSSKNNMWIYGIKFVFIIIIIIKKGRLWESDLPPLQPHNTNPKKERREWENSRRQKWN